MRGVSVLTAQWARRAVGLAKADWRFRRDWASLAIHANDLPLITRMNANSRAELVQSADQIGMGRSVWIDLIDCLIRDDSREFAGN